MMLENDKYSLGREYEFYAKIPSPRIREAVAIKKGITHKRLNIKTTIQVVALKFYLIEKGKRTVCSIYLPSTDQVTEEDMRDLLEQLPVPMILLGDFNSHNPLRKKINTRGRMLDSTSCA